MKQTQFALRYKFLLIFSFLGLVSLLGFAYVAAELFRKDKISYVFETSLQQARSASESLKNSIEDEFSTLQTLAQASDLQNNKLLPFGEFIFKEQNEILQFSVVEADSLLERISTAKSVERKIDFSPFVTATSSQSRFIKILNANEGLVVLGIKGQSADKKPLWNIVLARNESLRNFITDPSQSGILLHDTVTSQYYGRLSDVPANLQGFIHQWAKSFTSSEGTKYFQLKNEKYLTSLSDIGYGNLVVISIIKDSIAFAALARLNHFSIYFALALFAVFVLVSWFSATSVTSKLELLSEATVQIAKGNFTSRVSIDSSDEVGVLSSGFNAMASEVERLLSETAEKARMEAELKTAQTVQNTLFPATQAEWPGIKIRGHYESASECGGDWWYYHKNGDRVFIWIGDATGHGAPAALITSAARAAASLVEWQPDITPGQALRILNRAIYSTSKGEMMMTFFIGCFDLKNKTFSYSNASHNPPFHIESPHQKAEVSKGDFNPLVEANNPRLGQSLDHFFTDHSMPITDGDYVIFFTDGVTEMKNKENKDFGERKFLKSLSKAFADGHTIDDVINISLDAVNEHRDHAALTDDVTYIVCQFGEGAQQEQKVS